MEIVERCSSGTFPPVDDVGILSRRCRVSA